MDEQQPSYPHPRPGCRGGDALLRFSSLWRDPHDSVAVSSPPGVGDNVAPQRRWAACCRTEGKRLLLGLWRNFKVSAVPIRKKMKTSATNAPGQGAPPVSHSPRPLTHPNQMLAWDVVCPSSPARLAWDVWMMALVAYLCCVVPYEVGLCAVGLDAGLGRDA
jgi:hypothetical protein